VSVLTRLLHLCTLLIGVLGVALCVAAGVFVFRVAARVTQANDRVFDGVDAALVAGRDRVLAAERRVQEAKITTEDVRQGVESWARREAAQRVASQPEIENTIARLGLGLQRVDDGLEISRTSLQNVQQALGLASSLGAAADPALVDPFLEKVNALRGRVSESTETVDAIRTRIQAVATGESLEERLGRLAQLTLRVVLTLGDIDARLGEVADGLVASRSRAQGMRERLGRYILLAEIGAFVLVAWMAVGQIVLARYGWTKVRATKGRRKP